MSRLRCGLPSEQAGGVAVLEFTCAILQELAKLDAAVGYSRHMVPARNGRAPAALYLR